MTDCIICVAVENAVYHFDKLFNYKVPKNLIDKVKIGIRVLVPFGRGNSKRQAMIMKFSNENEVSRLKCIDSIIDSEPVLNIEMIQMVEFIKSHYFCTYYDAIRAMLPLGITYKVYDSYRINNDLGDVIFDLSENERIIVNYVISKGGNVLSSDMFSEFSFVNNEFISEMVHNNILVKSDSVQRRLNDKLVKMVRIVPEYETILSNVKLTSKQLIVLDTLKTIGSVSVKEICYYTGFTASVVDSLVKKNIAEYYDDEVFRIPKTIVKSLKQFNLTDEQKNAFSKLLELYKDNKAHVSLLYGITGSGKTSVFMKLIEVAESEGKDVLVMVPEIALTPQLISLFKAQFGDKVAIFHSALSMGERLDEYKRVQRGIANIVIGTRSAVFAPLNNLGLIIMDEEQEHTYKSEGTPRYHARELSKFRCNYNNALLVLSSATPSIETFYNAEIGKYKKVTLTKRYGNAVLPEVISVDMNDEIENGNVTEYSSRLLEEIEFNLNDGKQSILLLNRRGHNTYVSCRSCKESINCPNCSITLTYHSANNKLMCHYCGYSINVPTECPECGSNKLRFSGVGTQRALVDLAEIFPNARILRMDTDATMSKSSHEKLLTSFQKGEYDILIGTQMVAKGLDFHNVTLVGILDADQMLYSNDYRSFENTFSLLTQVIGRSGRGDSKGRAIIQSHNPESPIITLSKTQNYDSFYNDEIVIRKALLYPPFVEMVLIGFVGDDKKICESASRYFTDLITNLLKEKYSDIPIRLLGPSPQNIVKINNKYRYKLIIKSKNNYKFREMLSTAILVFLDNKSFSKISIYADVAPLEL